MSNEQTYEGQCYCGAVKFTVSGEPLGAGYCHCKNCRAWSAGPVNTFTLWPPEAVQVTEGAEHIGEYNANEQTYRQPNSLLVNLGNGNFQDVSASAGADFQTSAVAC